MKRQKKKEKRKEKRRRMERSECVATSRSSSFGSRMHPDWLRGYGLAEKGREQRERERE